MKSIKELAKEAGLLADDEAWVSPHQEALKLAEEAVEDIVKNATNYDRSIYFTKAVAEKALAAIREARVEQGKQEPVAWKEFNEWLHRELPSGTVIGDPGWWASKIYKHFIQNAAQVSAKREWVDLTDDDINKCVYATFEDYPTSAESKLVSEVIAAFKEKNK
jgi:hypothetical protein